MLALSLSFLNFIALGVYGLFPSRCTSLFLSHLALPPECIILWVFLELSQLFMSVFALPHLCSSITSPLISLILSLPLFFSCVWLISVDGQTNSFFFCFFNFPFFFFCHAVFLCVRHANTRMLTVTPVQEQQWGALCPLWNDSGESQGRNTTSKGETGRCTITQTGFPFPHTLLLILLPHKQLLCD